MIQENKLIKEGEVGYSGNGMQDKTWDTLWKMKMIPKVKAFI